MTVPGNSSQENQQPVALSVTPAYVTDMATRLQCPICDQESRPTAKRPAVRCLLNITHKQGRTRLLSRRYTPVCADCVASAHNRVYVESDSGLARADLPPGDLEAARCEVCGIHVTMPHDTRRKHFVCGDSCRPKLYQTPPVEKTVTACVECGSEFTARRGARYCSSACRQRAYRKAKRGHRDGR